MPNYDQPKVKSSETQKPHDSSSKIETISFIDNRPSTKTHATLQQVANSNSAIQLAPLIIGTNRYTLVKDINTLWSNDVKPVLDARGIGSWGKKKVLREFFDCSKNFLNEEEFLWSLENSAIRVPVDTSRKRPKWDKFWKELHPKKGEHRRHIVESSVMKSAVYKVVDTATTQIEKYQVLQCFNSLLGTSETDIKAAEYKMAFI